MPIVIDMQILYCYKFSSIKLNMFFCKWNVPVYLQYDLTDLDTVFCKLFVIHWRWLIGSCYGDYLLIRGRRNNQLKTYVEGFKKKIFSTCDQN